MERYKQVDKIFNTLSQYTGCIGQSFGIVVIFVIFVIFTLSSTCIFTLLGFYLGGITLLAFSYFRFRVILVAGNRIIVKRPNVVEISVLDSQKETGEES